MSGRVIMMMTVFQGSDWASSGSGSRELWAREWVAEFVPQPGQDVAMLRSEEEPCGSVHEEITHVYYDWDLTPVLNFPGIIVDPNEQGQQTLQRQMTSPNRRSRRIAWYTDRDGDLEARLRESGWLPYSEWPEHWRG